MKVATVFVLLIVSASLVSISEACAPSTTPTNSLLPSCATTRAPVGTDLLGQIGRSDPVCTYKYAWTASGTVNGAKNYTYNQYQQVYHYDEPLPAAVTFTDCSDGYSMEKYFCAEQCESQFGLTNIENNEYPFKSIECVRNTTTTTCTDSISCKCTDLNSLIIKAGPFTYDDVVTKFNTSCLNCVNNVTNAQCTWPAVAGASAGTKSQVSSSNIKTNKQSSSSVSTGGSSSSSSGGSGSSSSSSTSSTDAYTKYTDTLANMSMTEDDPVDTANVTTTAATTWFTSHTNDGKMAEADVPKAFKRTVTALINKTRSSASEAEKTKADKKEMQQAVNTAANRRAARKLARLSFLAALLAAYTDLKRAKIAAIADFRKSKADAKAKWAAAKLSGDKAGMKEAKADLKKARIDLGSTIAIAGVEAQKAAMDALLDKKKSKAAARAG